MEQKTTWMRYLLLGSIITVLLLSFSCKKEYSSTGEYHYINKTNNTLFKITQIKEIHYFY